VLGDELLLNVNQATKAYVEGYKVGRCKLKPELKATGFSVLD